MEATHGEAFNTKHAAEIAAGTLMARGPNQQAKFLEQPARELNNNGTFASIMRQTVSNGGTIKDGLLLCGMKLQAESQKICPVDADSKTGGNLRGSAFTQVEQNGVTTR